MIRFFLILIAIIILITAILDSFHNAFTIRLVQAYDHICLKHLLGTDALGRCVFSRLLLATKYSLIIVFSTSFLTVLIGSIMGVISAFKPGFFDHLNTYIFEFLMAIPYIPLMMIIMGIQLSYMNMGYDFSLTFYILVLGLMSWPPTMKIVRGRVHRLKNEDFMRSAYAMGLSKKQIIVDVLYKNLKPTLKLQFAICFGQFMIVESVLSYLGLGVQSPYLSLGSLIQEYQTVFISHPELLLYPCAIVFMLSYLIHYYARKV